VLRCGPFHGYDSLVSFEPIKNSMRDEMPERDFFLARQGRGFTETEVYNGTEEEAKQCHKMWYVVRKLNATGGVEVVEKKLVTHFEKIMCRVHEFA
jgi:hypothetical protein